MNDRPTYEAILTRRGLSVEQLCQMLEIGQPTWRAWLRGDRKPSTDVCLRGEQHGIGKHELRPDLWPPSAPPPPRPPRRKAMAAA